MILTELINDGFSNTTFSFIIYYYIMLNEERTIIDLADVIASHIISCKDKIWVPYSIDMWEWDFVEFEWYEENKMYLRQNFNDGSMVANIPLENPSVDDIKEYLIMWLWVNEEELDEYGN